MRSEFSKSAFMSASNDDARQRLCAQLGAVVTERLRGPAGFALEAQTCIEALRALGHDLWSFDESPDFQVWAPNYAEPTGAGIIVTMWADGRAVVEWTPK